MRVWAGIAIGLAVVALAVLFFPLVQIQRDLRLANEQVVQTGARVAELERVVANLKSRTRCSQPSANTTSRRLG
jgi:hypothetical protein